jgi:V/A-type H+-transporting ATPase subunit D
MGLLEARSRRKIAAGGARLLRSKREVLASEFFRLMREALEGRARLDECLGKAGRALAIARAIEGDAQVSSLALGAGRDIPIEVKLRSVWGVAVPAISAPRLVRTADARGASALSWGLVSAEAARQYEGALEVLLGIASRELHLQRLGEELQQTSRRINALEQLVVPRLAAEEARIDIALEERTREETVRLKRFRRARRQR